MRRKVFTHAIFASSANAVPLKANTCGRYCDETIGWGGDYGRARQDPHWLINAYTLTNAALRLVMRASAMDIEGFVCRPAFMRTTLYNSALLSC